jgi:hypothetical protein
MAVPMEILGKQVVSTQDIIHKAESHPTNYSPKFTSDSESVAPLNVYCSVFFLFGLRDYRHCGHSWPIVPASGDNEDDCGEHDGM